MVVTVGLVALIGGLGWAAFAVLGAAFDRLPGAPIVVGDPPVIGGPPVAGEPGPPRPVDPLFCSTPCYTSVSVNDTQPNRGLVESIGLDSRIQPLGAYDPVEVAELFRLHADEWDTHNGTPDYCFFVTTNAPLPPRPTLRTGDDDMVYFTGTWSDRDRIDTLDQSVRVFPDSASALMHMIDLADLADACRSVEIGPPNDRYVAIVDPAAALDLPPSVAGVGWVRTGDLGPRWRAYVVDLVHGNLVVRTRLLTDGSISEAEFRTLIEEYAKELAAVPVETDPPAVG